MLVVFAIAAYHIALIAAGLYVHFVRNVAEVGEIYLWVNVMAFGLVGGCIYCLRALYLQYCVKNHWENRWVVWHVIRPVVSTILGMISLVFVKAGFLLLDVSEAQPDKLYGFYALAFIAGYNVDNFMRRLENIAKSIMQIDPTNVHKTPPKD